MTDEPKQDVQAEETAEEAKEKKAEEKAEPEKKATKAAPKTNKKVQDLIEEIEKLTVLELADLVKALEEKFGPAQVVAAPVAGAAPAASQAPSEATAEPGQTTFNVIVASAGANKISVIKAVREINQNLGLKEAKDLVEALPKELLTGVNKATAEEAKQKLEAAGATVELK